MTMQKVIESLNEYAGDETSLNAFVTTVTDEIGPDWTDRIYEELKDIPPSLKEKLDHAFNYYAATTAWNEIQTYINQAEPLDYTTTAERVPVLEHWLTFFGAAGQEAVSQLQSRLKQEGDSQARDTSNLDEPFAPLNEGPLAEIQQEAPSVESVLGTQNEPETNFISEVSSEQDSQNFKPSFVDEEINVAPLSPEELQERISDIFSGADEMEDQSQDTSVLVATDENINVPQPQAEPVILGEIQNAEPLTDEIQSAEPLTDEIQNTEPLIDEIQNAELEDVSAHESMPVQPMQTAPVQAAVQPQQQVRTLASVVGQVQQTVSAPVETHVPLQAESESQWRISKIFKQLDFVVSIQAWVSKRCHDLGYTDYYTYRYYGFLVDVLDTTIEELKGILGDTGLYDLIETRHPDGVRYLQNQLLAFEKQSKEAHEGILADLSPLPREGLSIDDLKRNLGGMDTSESKEYLGPAPDGFEMIEDPYANLSDETLQKEYAKIEETGNLPVEPATELIQETRPVQATIKQTVAVEKNQAASVNNTSQTPQNGVQRKMSFNFGPKKPSGSDTTGA